MRLLFVFGLVLIGCGGPTAQERYASESEVLEKLEWELSAAESESLRAFDPVLYKYFENRAAAADNWSGELTADEQKELEALRVKFDREHPEYAERVAELERQVAEQKTRVTDAKDGLGL